MGNWNLELKVNKDGHFALGPKCAFAQPVPCAKGTGPDGVTIPKVSGRTETSSAHGGNEWFSISIQEMILRRWNMSPHVLKKI